MSEYQYYEFSAIDRRLTDREMEELRRLSTRAEITPTSFSNEYEWGGFKGNPREMMHRYFDASLYLANWGSRWLMLRLPRGLIDEKAIAAYAVADGLAIDASGDFIVLDFGSERDGGDWDDDGRGWLGRLARLRDELLAGDYRALYLGWLCAVRSGEVDVTDVEPPVPPGLGSLSGSLEALAEFLRVDSDLIEVAARNSDGVPPVGATPPGFADFMSGLPAAEKDGLLLRVADNDALGARWDLLKRFYESRPSATVEETGSRRTVRELIETADELGAERERAAAERKAREAAEAAAEKAAAREAYLQRLAGRVPEVWTNIAALVSAKPQRYDEAVVLLSDLKTLANRSGGMGAFRSRLLQLRERHARKPAFLARMRQAGLD